MITFLAFPLTVAKAQTSQPTEVKRVRLSKGERAPFNGNLLSDVALAKLVTDFELKIKKLEAKLEKEKLEHEAELLSSETICQTRIEGEQAKKKALESGYDQERAIYEKALKKCTDTPWYKSPYLHFLAGSIIAGGICVAAKRDN